MKFKIEILGVIVSFFGILFYSNVFSQNSKTILSEKWKFGNYDSPVFFKTKSKTDNLRNVYVVGSTLNSQNNRDLIIQKLDPAGNLIWQNVVDGDANLDDVGTDLFIDDQLNVFVTGTVNRLGTQEDLVVLKYTNDGSLEWEYYTDTFESESGSAITLSASNLFVTGVSTNLSTQSDYLIISLDEASGSLIWSNTYNYSNLNEVPISIKIHNNNLYVTGASQLSVLPQVKWEIATVLYDALSGIQIATKRSSGNATQGVDEVHDFTIDNNGNIYICGGVVNQSTGFDIAVYKLDNNLNLIWEQFYDVNGLDDIAYGIELDFTGNIYLTGFDTKQNEGKNIFIKKLGSTGNLIWTRDLRGSNNSDDIGTDICILNDSSIFITGNIRNSNNSDFLLAGFSESGQILTSIDYDSGLNLDDTPTSMAIDLDGNIVVSGQSFDGNVFKTRTLKYEIFEKNMDYYSDSIGPLSIKNNIIVRFTKEAVNLWAFENKEIRAGNLSTFLKATTTSELTAITGFDWDNLVAYKIHTKFGPNDSLSITRYGDTISTYDFWTALCIETPKGYSEGSIVVSLSTLDSLIISASVNAVYSASSLPNDEYVNTQLSLFQNTLYPNADINVETAWNYEVGNENIKVGVVDRLVNYYHEDFGNGTFSGSKVRGYDCVLNQDISLLSMAPTSSHGTSCAGIIGAIRNNNQGIAGIAGGDLSNSLNKGVQIISLVVFGYDNSNNTTTTAELVEAITLGNLETTAGNGYGVHIQNLSLGGTIASGELNNILKEGFKNGCIYVAARGNRGLTDNAVEYPACYKFVRSDGSINDSPVLDVIASGTDGNRKTIVNGGNLPIAWESSYGLECSPTPCQSCMVDFMAPGTNEIITSTIASTAVQYEFSSCAIANDVDYGCFNGTSAAAPHVTGVAALMLSKHQQSNGFPNVLISEDVERILEKTSGNQNLSYSLQSGYGLIDAGLALEQVSNPFYVKHISVPITTAQDLGLIDNGASQTVSANPFGVPPGTYQNARRYQCYWNSTETLPSGHNIIDYWKLDAMTQRGMIGTPTPNFAINPNVIQNENLTVAIGGNIASIYAVTNIYKLTNSAGQSYWFPASPENMKYVYSLHVKKQPDASIDELTIENVRIFPNPSKNAISIKFDYVMDAEFTLEIIDAIGKTVLIKNVNPNTSENIVISELKQGVYFCKIYYNDNVFTKTLIKSE